jgi:hypothetical protein
MMSTNLDNLTPDVVSRVDDLAAGTAKRQPKDGGALRAARKEQAASRKPAKSPAAKTPDPDKLSRDANRAVKRAVVEAMRGIDFDALSKGVDAYPELHGVKPELMLAEINRHARYLEPKK